MGKVKEGAHVQNIAEISLKVAAPLYLIFSMHVMTYFLISSWVILCAFMLRHEPFCRT